MVKNNLCKIVYFPVFIIFAGVPLTHDVIPYHEWYNTEDWFALAGMYALGILIASPLYYLLWKYDKYGKRCSVFSIISRVIFTLFLQIICSYFLWNDSPYLYLSLAAIMGISSVIFGCGQKALNLLKDKDTGSVYEIRGCNAYKLDDAKVKRIQTNMFTKGIQFSEFSPSQFTGFDANSTVFPVDCYSSSSDMNQSIVLNPSSGMPMVGGISGLDIHGNSWGTNFNEPSNTYDPVRGY
ncbi:hypothetical protein IIF46_003288 [Salmonella enterica]|nr:hypothetical protein [Salmonella enterica]